MTPRTTIAIIDGAAAQFISTELHRARRSIEATIYSAQPLTATTSARMRHFWAQLTDAPRRVPLCSAILCAYSLRTPHATANLDAAAQLAAAGWIIGWTPPGRILHAKSWLFDRERLIVGSHNLTDAALHQNRELSLLTDEPEVIAAAADYYTRLRLTSTDQNPHARAPWPG